MNAYAGSHPPRGVGLQQGRSRIVAVLDIGTSKICCMIAKLKPLARATNLPGRTHAIECLGIGHQLSRGVKAGVIVDLDDAEQAVRAAVDAAERMAGLSVESVIVNVSCGRIRSEAFSANVSIDGHEVEESDIQRVLVAGRRHAARSARSVVHAMPIGYTLDGNRGIRDPRGMIGDDLGVDIHVVSAEAAPMRNLSLCVGRGHLKISRFVASPYAAALACLVSDEADLGTLVVDMGGGTTGTAIFRDGSLVYGDVVALGGQHVTTDIARGLSTSMSDAERLKTLYGSALHSVSDEREMISVPMLGDDGFDGINQIPKSMLSGIIRPRLEEILELVRDRLRASGFERHAGKHIVLTGGASQLTGARELAQRILGRQVRIGRPLGVEKLPDALAGPAFTASAGLLVYPQVEEAETIDFQNVMPARGAASGYFARVGQWIREAF